MRKEEEIYLVPYDPSWLIKFMKEKKLVEKTLDNSIKGGVHHVGSTSIPRLLAKPIIDIMVGVDNLTEAEPCIKLLEKIGYCYFPYKPKQMHWFCKPSPYKREYHLYLMVKDSPQWKARIAFRNYLKKHAKVRKEYEVLKIKLAKKYQHDRERYTDAKARFIRDILDKAEKS